MVATDGVNTGQDDSDAPFTIERKRPEAAITSPAGALTVTAGTVLLFHGNASDAEDGPLPDGSLAWSSPIDGPLGTGPEVVASLSPGVHAVTFTARDSDGQTGSATVAVTVIPAENPPTLGLERPGDCNQDGALDLSDTICVFGHLFLGTPAALPCGDGSDGDPSNRSLLDVNGDGRLDISDGIHLLGFSFLGGPPPVLGTDCVAIPACASVCSR